MKKILLLLLCVPLLGFSQTDKRLALVIGNANYDKSELKNPVNDALLIAETLRKLDFDVILDTNITDRNSFIKTIGEFVKIRTEYNVALVYYAGHGIQVDYENFLLPTKEVFESEHDVRDYGVSVQDIMRSICGDTKHCNSLIAFSTSSGHVSADGDGENSLYCKSLCKNMIIKDISLSQIFRNVRKEISIETDGNQNTTETSTLINYYYLSKSISDKVNIFILDSDRNNPFDRRR